MGAIELRNVSKSFGDTKVIENLNLTIADGKFTVLIGSSGCGKTTLLRMIAGIGPQTAGSIYIDGRDVTAVAPANRDIAMVFQNYAIYPMMTVKGNIEFGLKNRKVPKEEREKRIEECARVVGMTEYLSRKPDQLSGGQRQRIALARAMVKQPSVFLMDEPLSNLDAKLRASMRVELKELQRKLRTTFVYVTHDQIEAMSMADTIVLMEKGKIQQIGSPEEMYEDPNNLFCARFIGTPPMNVLPLGAEGFSAGFRAEKAVLHDKPVENGICMRGKIITREMLGGYTQYKVALKEGSIMVKTSLSGFFPDNEVFVCVDFQDVYLFDEHEQRIRKGHQRYEHSMRLAGEMQK